MLLYSSSPQVLGRLGYSVTVKSVSHDALAARRAEPTEFALSSPT